MKRILSPARLALLFGAAILLPPGLPAASERIPRPAGDGIAAAHLNLGNLRLSASEQAPQPELPSPPVFVGEAAPPASPLTLWYRRPAKRWLEALPIGNGRLGAMVFGGVATEKLALNESAFWSGAPDATHDNPAAWCEQQLAAAASRSYLELRARHRADCQPLFRRVSLDLGPSPAAQLPTDEWLARVRRGEDDPALVALFPSEQITPRATPDLAKAARVTLDRRIGRKDWEDVEWSRGNLIAFFARLAEGDAAYHHLLGLLREDTDADLLTFSRGGIAGAPENIFCVDGNSAGTAGIAEMLLQSHVRESENADLKFEIALLPALPKAWPNGSVKGLKARGNVTVDLEWRDGKVTSHRLTSPDSREVKVRRNGNTTTERTTATGCGVAQDTPHTSSVQVLANGRRIAGSESWQRVTGQLP